MRRTNEEGDKSNGITGGHTCAHSAGATWARKSVSDGVQLVTFAERYFIRDGEMRGAIATARGKSF